jgi:hypothetical protein
MFTVNSKKIYYAVVYNPDRTGSGGRIALVDQYLYSHGQKDQKYPECCCYHSGGDLVAAGIWPAGRFEETPRVKITAAGITNIPARYYAVY